MPRPMMAVDIDLRAIYCWCSECGLVASEHENMSAVKLHAVGHKAHNPLVLAEVAGAVDYTDNKAVAHNKRRWTIWNIAAAAHLWGYCLGMGIDMLVAPSSIWTHGHDVKVRHALAMANAKNKDLRETQAMIWSYSKSPMDWVPFSTFLEKL